MDGKLPEKGIEKGKGRLSIGFKRGAVSEIPESLISHL